MTELSAYGGKAMRLLQLKESCSDFFVPNFFIVSWNDSLKKVSEQLKSLKGSYFAVRSSANVEDNTNYSFAGLFASQLFVPKENVLQAINDVRTSVNTTQVQEYCKLNNINIKTIKMNVVVQEMINADCAGVLFSKQPNLPEINEVVISAVYGIGKGVVDGELNADEYKGTANDWQTSIANKQEQYRFQHQQFKKINVEPTRQQQPCLTPEQCNLLEQVALQLEQLFGTPQDIEFAYKNEKLYILQSRDITNLPTTPLKVWDNSNIVESYPGITLPFTFSFILKLYETVYQNIGLLLGVRQQQINANKDVFQSMLGHIKGRVYYDLENWYKALSMLPAYKLNAPMMEKMMGVSKPLRMNIVTKQPLSKPQAIAQLIQSVFKILLINKKLPQQKEKFSQMIRATIEKYQSVDFSSLTVEEIWENYLEFREILVHKWNPPLANDLFAMFYFGSLEKFCSKHFNLSHLHLDLIVGRKEVHSTKPAILLEKIIETAKNEKRFHFFQNKEFDVIVELITANKFGTTGQLIQTYIQEFGDRFVGELKLENDTFRQKPKRLFEIISSYSSDAFVSRTPFKKEAVSLKTYQQKLPFLTRWWFSYLVKKASETVADRENLRLERTKVFGMVRVFMLAIGTQLVKEKIIPHKKDIFYLKEDEVAALIANRSTFNTSELINQRKKEFEQFKTYKQLPNRIFQRGKLTEDVLQVVEEPLENELVGLPCSPGIVTEKVVVLNSPNEVECLEGAILVTKSTDPGWITIFKNASAILVERGSSLSHSAIVSRELGIPCIVAVKGITTLLQTGDTVQMNGTTGKITKIETSGHSH